jgi:hypothetical protein
VAWAEACSLTYSIFAALECRMHIACDAFLFLQLCLAIIVVALEMNSRELAAERSILAMISPISQLTSYSYETGTSLRLPGP